MRQSFREKERDKRNVGGGKNREESGRRKILIGSAEEIKKMSGWKDWMRDERLRFEERERMREQERERERIREREERELEAAAQEMMRIFKENEEQRKKDKTN